MTESDKEFVLTTTKIVLYSCFGFCAVAFLWSIGVLNKVAESYINLFRW